MLWWTLAHYMVMNDTRLKYSVPSRHIMTIETPDSYSIKGPELRKLQSSVLYFPGFKVQYIAETNRLSEWRSWIQSCCMKFWLGDMKWAQGSLVGRWYVRIRCPLHTWANSCLSTRNLILTNYRTICLPLVCLIYYFFEIHLAQANLGLDVFCKGTLELLILPVVSRF